MVRGRPPRGAVVVVSDQLEGQLVVRAMKGAPGVSTVVQDKVIAVALDATTVPLEVAPAGGDGAQAWGRNG